ncbi:MAG: hypothetical protein EBU90_19830 [Proteobacteria bacterium]|nr:hypothetical protein [Pseudomonadota bacterium]
MAETFRMYNQTLTTANANVYVSPANTTSIVILGQIANIDTTAAVDVYVSATDAANTSTRFLAKKIPVPAAAATTFLSGKLVLEAGDYVTANANANSGIDMTVSVLQIT